MTDMSTSHSVSMDIFMKIMDFGPQTLYSTNASTGISIATIHRHIKQLEDSGKIKIYQSASKGRKKIEYGPTLYGIISFYRHNKNFSDKIQNYFLLWIENKVFQKELENEGFDISGDLKRSKQVFQEYMEYFSAVEEQIEKIKNGESAVSRDILILISSGLLSSDPHYQKLWENLYQNLPGMRKSLDDFMTNMIKNYKHFQKQFNSKN